MPSGLAILLVRCPLRAPSRVELHLAAEKVIRAEAAEHDVGVGDGRLGAAAAVADRAGIGAGALRADLQGADFVDPGDAAAAGADFDDVDHRHHDRMAAGVAADVIAWRHGRLAVADQAGLGGRAAHVEGDDVADSRASSPISAEAMMPPTGPDSIIATGRLIATSGAITPPFDCMIDSSPREADAFEARLQVAHIAADVRADIGVHHRRRDALVLAVFAQDLVRERDIGVRQRRRDDLARARARARDWHRNGGSTPRPPRRLPAPRRAQAARRLPVERARRTSPGGIAARSLDLERSDGAAPAADGDGRKDCRLRAGCRGR